MVLRNRGYIREEDEGSAEVIQIDEEFLGEASLSIGIPAEKLKTMFVSGGDIEALKILATKTGAAKAAKKLELIGQLKDVEEGKIPYELESYYMMVRKDLMSYLKEKVGKDALKDILPIV